MRAVRTSYSITEIENAINYWRSRQASGEDLSVCPRARALADVYGAVIFHRRESVDAKTLTAYQNEAMSTRDFPSNRLRRTSGEACSQ